MSAGEAWSLHGAEQVLLPPQEYLPHLRHDRAAELRLQPGGLTLTGGGIAALHADPGAPPFDCTGGAILPGFVDCHTHLPFAGWRAREYEQKVTGVPYEEIAREGGGIRASARAFAETPDDAVLHQATGLAHEMLRHGTTTLEGKSGYGLSVEQELRALRLAKPFGRAAPQRTTSTALLAHAVPDGYTAATWMDEVAAMLPAVAADTKAEALDIFVESIAFGLADLTRMGALAQEYGYVLRAHVEQLSAMGSVPVAIAAGARSVDHLSCLPAEHVAPLAAAECAAVLLPSAELLGGEAMAPGRALADAGAICVLATDLNPGTSPVASLPLVIGLAVRRYGWTVREALLAVTLNAAWVLGRSHEIGSIELDKRGDVIVLDSPVEHIAYRFGHNPVAAVFTAGRLAWIREDQRWRLGE